MHDSDSEAMVPEMAAAPAASLEASAASNIFRVSLAWLGANAEDLVIALSIAALCVMRRIETLDPVNTGGDAAIKWQFVRQWFYSHDFAHAPWNHHMTRFGVLVPAYFAQRWFGHGLRGYYALPIAVCALQVVFVYACGKRLSGRLAGVLAALLLIYASFMATAGSQVLPDLFTGTYGIVMLYLYLRYADAQGKARLGWLVGCAGAAFVGYLAKETMVFFYPGMAIAIWLAGRKPRELLIFFGLLLVGLALETAAYRAFTDYSSRFAIVVASHVGSADDGGGRADTTFWGLFERYQHIDKGWVVAFYIFLPCWFGMLGLTRNFRVRAALWVVFSFFFCLTFLVRSLHPLLLWHRFMSRYLDPTAPFVQLVTGLFLALVLDQLWQERGDNVLWQRLARLNAGAVVLALSAALGLYSYSNLKEGLADHSFTVGNTLAAVATDAYRRNLPIVIRRTRSPLYARDLETLYAIYLDPRDLARNGRLPPFSEAKRATDSFTYLAKNPAALSADRVSRLMQAGCVVELRERNPFMTSWPSTELPGTCDALRAN